MESEILRSERSDKWKQDGSRLDEIDHRHERNETQRHHQPRNARGLQTAVPRGPEIFPIDAPKAVHS